MFSSARITSVSVSVAAWQAHSDACADPPNITKFQNGVKHVQAANRVYYAGEFDWTDTRTTGKFQCDLCTPLSANKVPADELSSFLKAIEAVPGTGTAIWSLFGHSDDCCSWVEHDDGFSFYYKRDEHYTTQGEKLVSRHFLI